MQNKNTYIAILVFLVVFGLIMFLAFGVDNLKKNKLDTVLVVGDNTIWTYSKQRWGKINNNTQREELNWQEFNVFKDNEKFGKYLLWYSDKWYLFDKDRNAIVFDGSLLAYQANYDIDVLKFQEQQIVDKTYINYVLEENGLDVNSQFTSNYKVDVDFDNDGELEEFYLITNAFPIDFNPENIFSIVFMVKDDYIYYLYNDISKNTSFNGCKPYFKSILDVDNDGMYEFIVSCAKYSTSDEVDMLYKYVDDEFKIVISNQ